MGYHTDYTQELQDELNDCKRKYQSLFRDLESTEDELDAVKTDLAHEVNTLIESRDYWKETFEDFYNAILRITEQNEDLELTNKLIDKLLAYEGESNGQRQNNF